ncbi:MAG: DUF2339 domain-containing protein, partial [Leptospiraceae bacterium]|nr:DUF2339 domain-containing protein [Leptospiraceae bacterium]
MEAVYFVVLFIFFVILLFMISQLKEEIRKQREQLRDIETLLKKNGVSIPKEEKTETRKVPEAKIYSPPSEEPVRAKPPAGLVSLKAEATPQEEKLEEKQPEVIEKSVSREPVFFKQEILEEKPETGSKALSKIKSWILYGQEEVPVGSVEYAVATTWLLRIGIIAIVSALVYVLNWSIERNLIGPSARLLIGLLSASAMLLGGIKLINKKYHLIAQGLLGGGIATFYFSTYAAGHFYQMIPVGLEFLFMALITVGAGVVSVYTNSMLVAIFGIIGGFFTPILLSTGNANLPTLYTYMLLLNIGILSIAHF